MSEHHLPDCQECGNETATSFDPDGSMLCGACRSAEDCLQATEAGDPTVWIMQGDNGELINITASVVTPPEVGVASFPVLAAETAPRPPVWPPLPATWVVTPDGEVSRNPASLTESEKSIAWHATLHDLLLDSIDQPLDMSVFLAEVPQPVDVIDGEVVDVVDTIEPAMSAGDAVAHPSHYTSSKAHCKGCGRQIECIDIVEHMGYSLGNVTKYVWRCDLKHDAIEDLRKARQYLDFEIAKRERELAAQ